MATGLGLPAIAAPRPCPAGQELATIRVSTLKPSGSRAGFEEAARDHQKWYRDHGVKDNLIYMTDVLEYDKQGGYAPSTTKVLAIHLNPPNPKTVVRDAAYAAFVAKYRANSDIASEAIACVPKPKR